MFVQSPLHQWELPQENRTIWHTITIYLWLTFRAPAAIAFQRLAVGGSTPSLQPACLPLRGRHRRANGRYAPVAGLLRVTRRAPCGLPLPPPKKYYCALRSLRKAPLPLIFALSLT